MESITYLVKTMVHPFMIEFSYMGELHFANVFTNNTMEEVDIHLIDLRAHNKHKIVLKRTEHGFSFLKSSEPIHEDLLSTIITAVTSQLND